MKKFAQIKTYRKNFTLRIFFFIKYNKLNSNKFHHHDLHLLMLFLCQEILKIFKNIAKNNTIIG